MKEIVIATKNKGKIAEIKLALKNLPIKVYGLDEFDNVPDAIEDGRSFTENAMIKAKFYADYLNKACLADDSGLEVYNLNGEPGIFSARYAGDNATDSDNNQHLLKRLETLKITDTTCCFRCVLAFVDNETSITTEGICEGVILAEGRGDGGFGYDPLFFLPQYKKTMAELTPLEKNKISHRGIAIDKMTDKLTEYLK